MSSYLCNPFRWKAMLPIVACVLILLLSPVFPAGQRAQAQPATARLASPAAAGAAAEQERLAQALRAGGVVVLIRHSDTVPGAGDPPGFRHDDCPTQRNLSDSGRAQARRIGQWFRQQGIEPTGVRASPWCRTRETARLAFGKAQDWVPLSNLFGDHSRQEEHARQVHAAIDGVGPADLEVMVSHGVTINAFIGEYLQQGEMVVVQPAWNGADGQTGNGSRKDVRTFEVVGRLLVP